MWQSFYHTREPQVHEGLKNHKCDFCDKSFNQSGDLKVHIKGVHKGAQM